MYQHANPLFFICESPLHAGSGSDLGIVDLPIQRERHTGYPKIEGSSLKGAIRERFEQVLGQGHNDIRATFGPDSNNNDWETYAGALGFTDARLLLFPVKSMRGVFAWVTCPRIINRLLEDLKTAQIAVPFTSLKENTTTKGSTLTIKPNSPKIVLESYTFSPDPDDNTQEFANWLVRSIFAHTNDYWLSKSGSDIVVLSNDDFSDFVNLSTEVITRTHINNDTGTVKDGALFTEEYLPMESVLYSLVLAGPIFEGDKNVTIPQLQASQSRKADDVMAFFQTTLNQKGNKKINNRFQIGANATIGKGLVQSYLLT